jgi:site-specific DNA-cytosine methylase
MRVLELFCGIGGLAAALHGSDARVVGAFDQDPEVLATYRFNFPDHPAVRLDLSRVTPWELAATSADLWWLSPPCQPYSVRGNRHDLSDPRAASLLRIMEVIERLPDVKLPHCLAQENVPGFLDSQARQRLINALRGRGYNLQEHLLCPTRLGIPMRRERYYLAASLAPLRQLLLPKPLSRRPLHDYLDLPLSEDTPPELLLPAATITRFGAGLRILDPEAPSAYATCFAASYGRTLMHSGSFLHCRKGVRQFSPGEIARLMGFPLDFSFPAGLSLRRQWHQLGNSLSVDAVRLVVGTLAATV